MPANITVVAIMMCAGSCCAVHGAGAPAGTPTSYQRPHTSQCLFLPLGKPAESESGTPKDRSGPD